MKRVLRYCFSLMCIIHTGWMANAQSPVVRMEYFFDVDPGYGNGQQIIFTNSANDTSFSFTANIASLNSGIHNFYMRARSVSGLFSPTQRTSFFNLPVSPSLSTIEYFLDTDPGFGNGQQLSLPSSPADTSIAFTFNTSSITPGLHNLYARAKNASGQYSVIQKSAFFILPQPASLTQIEYFLDTDPGFGNGQQVPLPSSPSDTSIAFAINTSSNNAGLHMLYVRAKNASGQFSIVQRSAFYILPQTSSITQIEYFFDLDPGFGKGQIFPVTPNSGDTSITFQVNTNGLTNGTHRLFVRSKDQATGWSVTQSSNLYYVTTSEVPRRAEYFIDRDPGFGNGIPVAMSNFSDTAFAFFNVKTDTLSLGSHSFFIRTRDSLGRWSTLCNKTFCKKPGAGFTAPTQACVGQPVIFTNTSTDTTSLTTYAWDLGNDGTIDRTRKDTIMMNYSDSGTKLIRLVINTPSTCGADTFIGKINVNYILTPIVSIAANTTTGCSGTPFRFVATPINGGAVPIYQWRKNNQNIPGASDDTLIISNLSDQDSISCIMGSSITACLTTSVAFSNSIMVSVAQNVTPFVSISASRISICESEAITFTSITANGGQNPTYEWYRNGVVITGQQSSTVTLLNLTDGDSISVKLYSDLICATSSTALSNKVGISVMSIPEATINSGNQTSICAGSSLSLQANQGSGLSYVWLQDEIQVGGETQSSLSISSAGTYKCVVRNLNGCADTSSALAIAVANSPQANLHVTGDTVYCSPLKTLTLSTDTGGGNTFIWHKSNYDPLSINPLPDTIAASNVSSLNNPLWGNYYVEVIASNGCHAYSYPVSIKGYVRPTAVLSGSTQSVCDGQPVTITASVPVFGSVNLLLMNDTLNLPVTSDGVVTLHQSGVYELISYVPGLPGCSDTSSTNINLTVKPAPSATLAANTTAQCLQDNLFLFYPGNGLNNPQGTVYTYYFGDGQSTSQPAADHRYVSAGTYDVKLVASINGSCSDTGTTTVHIGIQPNVSFTVNQTSLCKGGPDFIFTLPGIPDSTIQLIWNTGDGSLFAGNKFTHNYKEFGSYWVTLTASSNDGCSAADSMEVEYNPTPKARFDYTLIGSSLGLINTSTILSGSMSYTWNLGNGNTSSATSLGYNYPVAGNYLVSLSALSDKGCMDSTSTLIAVTLQPITLYLPYFTAAGGSFFTGDGITLSSTLGEISMIQTFGDSLKPVILTQGFQQPDDFFNLHSGIDDNLLKQELALGGINCYPNPASTYFTLNYKFISEGHVTAVLYDDLGREVATLLNESNGTDLNSKSISVSEYKEGIYYIHLRYSGAEEKIFTSKLIISHY